MRGRVMMGLGLGLLAFAAGIAATVVYCERPTTLTVAVSSADVDDLDLMRAAEKLLKRRHRDLRLKVLPETGVMAASAALDTGDADLAVVRADVAMPSKGETVVLTHKDVAVLVAPGGSGVDKIEDLVGKRVGMLSSRPGDARVFEAARAQYDVAPDKVTTVPLKPQDVEAALTNKTVDVVFAVGPVANGLVPDTVKAVSAVGDGPPTFLPVAEAAAVAQRTAVYDSLEIVRGAFGGVPPRPADEFDTLGVTYRLVASTDLSDATVASLTRFLLSQRVALAELAPSARRMEAPSTDKGAPLPAHPGTAAYIDDEEESFLDRYSDFIYLGAMFLGVTASGLTAVAGRIGASGSARVEDLVAKLLTLLKQVRSATSAGHLDGIEDEVDGVVAAALDERCLRTLDERRVAALNMAVEQVRSAIRDRRRDVRRSTLTAANDSAPLAFDAAERAAAGPVERASSDS